MTGHNDGFSWKEGITISWGLYVAVAFFAMNPEWTLRVTESEEKLELEIVKAQVSATLRGSANKHRKKAFLHTNRSLI